MGLTQETCEPCRGGVPTLTDDELKAHLPQVPGWKVAEVGGVKRIQKEFTFPDFRKALDFTVKVGELAEHEGHHPDIHLSWGKVMVETWTHAIHGLHHNDFILAAKINALPLG
jgi:4a-hydroxytetrahydrobiopterin dehydratase